MLDLASMTGREEMNGRYKLGTKNTTLENRGQNLVGTSEFRAYTVVLLSWRVGSFPQDCSEDSCAKPYCSIWWRLAICPVHVYYCVLTGSNINECVPQRPSDIANFG